MYQPGKRYIYIWLSIIVFCKSNAVYVDVHVCMHCTYIYAQPTYYMYSLLLQVQWTQDNDIYEILR